MPVGLYADVHVPGPVILQLRGPNVDIVAATEEATNELPDDELLTLATSRRRVMVTQDIPFRVMAEDWQRTGRPFAGLVFGHQRYVSFGQLISDLDIIAKATDLITGSIASSSFRFEPTRSVHEHRGFHPGSH